MSSSNPLFRNILEAKKYPTQLQRKLYLSAMSVVYEPKPKTIPNPIISIMSLWNINNAAGILAGAVAVASSLQSGKVNYLNVNISNLRPTTSFTSYKTIYGF